MPGNTDTAAQIKDQIDDWRDQAGRGSELFGYESIVSFAKPPAARASEVERSRAADGSHISVVTMGCGLTTVDDHIDAITTWRELTR